MDLMNSRRAKRHQHIEERNRTFNHRGRVAVIEFNPDFIVVDGLKRIHHVTGIEHYFKLLAAELYRNLVAGGTYFVGG